MLDLDMNLKTDLGIDRLRRREILTALQQQIPNTQINLQNAISADLNTLGQIINYLKTDKAQKKTPPVGLIANPI
jgi:acyl carrier protein